MKIDISAAELSDSAEKHITEAKKHLVVKVIEPVSEKNEDLFTLWYAFYKDDAYSRKQKIPVYRDMFQLLQKEKSYSYLMFAYDKRIPLGAMWLVKQDNTLVSFGSGSIQAGYERFADYLLLAEAIRIAKETGMESVALESTSAFRDIIR